MSHDLANRASGCVPLIERRREQHRQRTGHELTDDNIWIRKRLRELNSLDATLAQLDAEEAPKSSPTRGAHDSAPRKADPCCNI